MDKLTDEELEMVHPMLSQHREIVLRMAEELRAHRVWRNKTKDAIELAWGIIANAYGGDWDLATSGWKGAAERWRDRFLGGIEESRAGKDAPDA